MKNYISINNQRIDLPDDFVEKILAAQNAAGARMAEYVAGDTVMIGDHEMIVLDHAGGATLLLRKDLLPKESAFGESNNYDGSYVDDICNKFAEEIAAVVGEDNVLLHTVDLTADDGLKDYGEVQRKASLLTADQCRRYVKILDKHKVDRYWWLATAYSTPAHDDDIWVKCVSPSGGVNDDTTGARTASARFVS